MSPQNMAASSTPWVSIAAWIGAAVGTMLIALSFANLGTRIPATGGCVEYSRTAFGDFAAFLVAWSYWIAQSTGGAALMIACLSYLTILWPALATANLLAAVIGIVAFWILVYLNVRGVRQGMAVSNLTTVLKLLPLVVFVVLAVFHFHPALLHTVSHVSGVGSGTSAISTLPLAIAIAAWSFTGFESATTAGGELRDPKRNIRKATIYGSIGLVIVYLLVNVLACGVLSQNQLAKSYSPIADMINVMTGGHWAGTFLALGVVISTLGCANGGIILASRTAFAASRDGLFPPIFSKVNQHSSPVSSIILSAILTSILVGMNYFQGLHHAFIFVMLLATCVGLITYLFGTAADIVLTRQTGRQISLWSFVRKSILPLVAFAYVLYIMYGTGGQAVMWGFILILGGIPLYLYVKVRSGEGDSSSAQAVASGQDDQVASASVRMPGVAGSSADATGS